MDCVVGFQGIVDKFSIYSYFIFVFSYFHDSEREIVFWVYVTGANEEIEICRNKCLVQKTGSFHTDFGRDRC